MNFKIIAFTIFSLLIFSCGNNKKAIEQSTTDAEKLVEQQKAVIGKIPKNYKKTTINSARVNGHLLHLNVSYSGGCEDQTFELIGSSTIMKSYPAKRPVALIRDDKDDTCREWITVDLTFEIKALADQQKEGNTIVLLLDNYEEDISYTFSE